MDIVTLALENLFVLGFSGIGRTVRGFLLRISRSLAAGRKKLLQWGTFAR